jgi:hypothetical protein
MHAYIIHMYACLPSELFVDEMTRNKIGSLHVCMNMHACFPSRHCSVCVWEYTKGVAKKLWEGYACMPWNACAWNDIYICKIFVHEYVCMHVSVRVWKTLKKDSPFAHCCLHVCIYIHIHVYICVYAFLLCACMPRLGILVCLHNVVCTHACRYACVCVCMRTERTDVYTQNWPKIHSMHSSLCAHRHKRT